MCDCRDMSGKFPEYPDEDEGGSALLFKDRDPAELEAELKAKEDGKEKGGKKGGKKSGKKDKKDKKKDKKGKGKKGKGDDDVRAYVMTWITDVDLLWALMTLFFYVYMLFKRLSLSVVKLLCAAMSSANHIHKSRLITCCCWAGRGRWLEDATVQLRTDRSRSHRHLQE